MQRPPKKKLKIHRLVTLNSLWPLCRDLGILYQTSRRTNPQPDMAQLANLLVCEVLAS